MKPSKGLCVLTSLGTTFCTEGQTEFSWTGVRTLFLKKRENEAHRFSVDLIYSDDVLEDFIYQPTEKAANYMGVSEKLAKYRISSIDTNQK